MCVLCVCLQTVPLYIYFVVFFIIILATIELILN